MAHADFRDRINLWRDLVWLAGLIVAISGIAGSILIAGVLALWGDALKAPVRDWLGITDLAADVAVVMGEDRILRQPPGMSYVREPVYAGEAVELVLYLGRTERGRSCTLLAWTPVFTDDNGVIVSGETLPPLRQIGQDIARLEVALQPPPPLRPGHTHVQLQLAYDCAGQSVFETTAPVSFYILDNP